MSINKLTPIVGAGRCVHENLVSYCWSLLLLEQDTVSMGIMSPIAGASYCWSRTLCPVTIDSHCVHENHVSYCWSLMLDLDRGGKVFKGETLGDKMLPPFSS